MKFKFISLLLLLSTTLLLAQRSELNTRFISDSLKENANAVVRLYQMDIVISSQRSMSIKNKRIVTVLNEKGLGSIEAVQYYDKKTSVKDIEAIVFDGFGKEIKKIKKKDFKDQSAVSGSTLFSDSRVMYLDYTPNQYPFTVVYECEIQSSNTAFLPQWLPLNDYFLSIEKSILNVYFPDNLGFHKKEFNFSNFQIEKIKDNSTQLSYVATNIKAQKPEEYSPSFLSIYPKVLLGLQSFHLEGVDGNAKTWAEFGKWYSDQILAGTTELSEETKSKIRVFVGEEKDPIKKAKLVYNYVQQKSRYISVQVGIGGWKPMLANDVDRLGYGDCKALTNYTRALLDVVNVPSYNTILYGDRNKKDIESEFVSMQGNHMILAIPNKDNYLWLECTSQDDPFGYQGTFTDDRNVLVIKPEGGEIVRTKVYGDKGNAQVSKGNYSILENGGLSGGITIISEGSQFSRKAPLEYIQPAEKDRYYKEYWANIGDLKIEKMLFSNDKENVSFTENIEIKAMNYGKMAGNNLIFTINTYNQYTGNIKRIRNRKNPFEIQRGYQDIDEISITLPSGFSIDFLPSNFELNSKFGEYKTEIIKKDSNNLVYKRNLYIKKGFYSNQEYDEYRFFIEQVSRNDNAKVILAKIN